MNMNLADAQSAANFQAVISAFIPGLLLLSIAVLVTQRGSAAKKERVRNEERHQELLATARGEVVTSPVDKRTAEQQATAEAIAYHKQAKKRRDWTGYGKAWPGGAS